MLNSCMMLTAERIRASYELAAIAIDFSKSMEETARTDKMFSMNCGYFGGLASQKK